MTAKTDVKCSLFRVHKEHLLPLLQEYPSVNEELRKAAEWRWKMACFVRDPAHQVPPDGYDPADTKTQKQEEHEPSDDASATSSDSDETKKYG